MLKSYRKTLLNYFERIQKIKNNPLECKKDCLSIQEALIKKILTIEHKLKNQKLKINNYKRILCNKNAITDRLSAQGIKHQMDNGKYMIEEYQYLLHLLREIGDALAYVFINKWDIKPLAFKESPGFISGKKGLKYEQKILKEIFQKGNVAILNDATNCLRYGDITIVDEGFLWPIEVKSNINLSDKDKKQLKKMRDIVNYIYTDKTDELYGTKIDAKRFPVKNKEVNHIQEINNLIKKAFIKGGCWEEVEEGLYYCVMLDFYQEYLSDILQRLKKPAICEIVNNFKYSNTAYYPFTLSIDDPEILFKFYCDDFVVIIFVDTEIIEKRFNDIGLKVEFNFDSEYIMSIQSLTELNYPEIKEIRVGVHFFNRIYTEFTSLEWVIKETIVKAENPHKTTNCLDSPISI